MREKINCPNCGAPITSEQCPFCGTMFYDFSAIRIGEPCYLKIKYNDTIMTVKAIANNAECTMSVDTTDIIDGLGQTVHSFTSNYNLDLSMDFRCAPFRGHLMEARVL